MSKYADLAHKIVDMVHATHKEEVRKARTEEKTKKAEEKKIKAEAEKDPEEDEKDEKEDEKDEKDGEDTKAPPEDQDADPVGDGEKKDGEEDEDEEGDEKKAEGPPAEGEEAPADGPPAGGAPPEAEAPPATDSMGRPMAGQGKKSPITPKKSSPKVKMSGKKEKVKVESFDDIDKLIRDRQQYLNERYSYDWDAMDKEFGVKEKMIAEGMWDGNIADNAEIYGKPDISQLQIYRLLELYKAAGMNLDQSLQTIEHLFGVQVQTDSSGNLDFSDTDYSKGDTYGMNMGQNLDYYKPSVIREQ